MLHSLHPLSDQIQKNKMNLGLFKKKQGSKERFILPFLSAGPGLPIKIIIEAK